MVNDDQLSLAIGKRGQNVRLAARLTGWDIDILTPPEFQAGVQRLDVTLKSIEGISQEHIDKAIALGLIDVRDIEEVGTGPLMEELGLEEVVAARVVEKCASEAKIVAAEQEAKKIVEPRKRRRIGRRLRQPAVLPERPVRAPRLMAAAVGRLLIRCWLRRLWWMRRRSTRRRRRPWKRQRADRRK